MDLRWAAYASSALLATMSLAPVTLFRSPDAAPAASRAVQRRAARLPSLALLDVERHTSRLSAYYRESPPLPPPGRNPFRFAERRAIASPPVRSIERQMPPPEPLVPASPSPLLTLVGMAERKVGDTLVRTAVVAGLGDVHLVTKGDRIGERFVVIAIGADAIEIEDEQTHTMMHLGLESRHQRGQ